MPKDRVESAYRVRLEAAEAAKNRHHPEHRANADEQRYASAHYPMSFTKGLEHDPQTGLVKDPAHFEAFRTAIDEGHVEPFTSRLHVPHDPECGRRKWEAPTAGIVYDLEGPDAQAVTMPPAPELCSDELAFEMAEVYELALLRDVPFNSFDTNGGTGSAQINASIGRLNGMDYAANGFQGRPRTTENGVLTLQTAFRGSSPGVAEGPYLSQFMLMGNDTRSGMAADQGFIAYGAQTIDQRVPPAVAHQDHMQVWEDWLDVQQGFDVNSAGKGKNNVACSGGQNFDAGTRFIYTPRHLATYVHFDGLYQAYLNATLILLGHGAPFDPGFAKLSGMRDMFNPVTGATVPQNAGGFALYGGPHMLTLVTEVATRALKAVRYQKFNNHLRLRPEALAGRIHRANEIDDAFPSTCGAFRKLREQTVQTLEAVAEFNEKACKEASLLLPMAFAEGSPMHPTYGAGHATVAGACTTIVKAFFDTGAVLGHKDTNDPCSKGRVGFFNKITNPFYYQAMEKGKKLQPYEARCPLTLEGELNKLAANISIGRNMAGVHYYSDYYDSLRMGEAIAIGMLEEQALCYPTDDFVLSIPTFDGDLVRIGAK